MKRKFILVEVLLAAITVCLGLYWWWNPDSNIEPLTVMAGGVVLFLEVLRRAKHAEVSGEPFAISNTQVIAREVEDGRGEDRYLPAGVGSRSLFYRRFCFAFPGVRHVSWFEGKAATDRLMILLAEPLRYGPEPGRSPPFWWWRGGNLQIESFERVDSTTVLMNWDELKIGRIAAVPHTDYKRCWVYVEAEPMPATGLYELVDSEERQRRLDLFGYLAEEYAVYRGQMIRRQEYDDGAAAIAGGIARLNGEATLRVRYLSPYNFVIAPFASPFNNGDFDDKLESFLNALLRGDIEFGELVEEVKKLPVPTRFEGRE